MKEIATNLTEVMNKIIDNRALAVTANDQLAKEGIILLTVYPKDGHKVDSILTEMNTSLLEGFPAQIEFRPSWFGVPTYENTLVYLGEGGNVILEKDSKMSKKPLQEGLEDLRRHPIQTVFDSAAVNAGGSLLRQYAKSHQPDEVFAEKHMPRVIEVYKVSRHEYAFGFHRNTYTEYISSGRFLLEYGNSRVSLVSSKELRESSYWQRNNPHEQQILPVK
jgi:hypothetical protein